MMAPYCATVDIRSLVGCDGMSEGRTPLFSIPLFERTRIPAFEELDHCFWRDELDFVFKRGEGHADGVRVALWFGVEVAFDAVVD